MSADPNILLVGLPSTGKTSFLAALWQVVNDQAANSSLTLERLDGDSKYLNRIRKAWLEYRAVPRTLVNAEKVVGMSLKSRDSNRIVRMTFPDLSGESFRLQWTTRQLTASYDELLNRATGVVLFVHPSNVLKPHRIDMVDDLVDALAGAEAGESVDAPASGSNVPHVSWDIEKAPTQVQLVDLLQFIAARTLSRSPFRVAVVVSAWDLVNSSGLTPAAWTSAELPLLRQYLNCNRDAFEANYYGLSAQGAQYPSWLFAGQDINNLRAFAKRLVAQADNVARWLWEQADQKLRASLEAHANAAEEPANLRASVVDLMNRLISTEAIDEGGRFAGTTLRAETEELLREKSLNDSGEEKIRLNRLLLEDAFPHVLSRDRQVDETIGELQSRQPTRRISLVLESGEESNDITEPVKWLMQ